MSEGGPELFREREGPEPLLAAGLGVCSVRVWEERFQPNVGQICWEGTSAAAATSGPATSRGSSLPAPGPCGSSRLGGGVRAEGRGCGGRKAT